MMRYFCCDEQRRRDVRNHDILNGIDFLEVMDQGEAPADRQRLLRLHFVKTPMPPVGPENVRISGGVRVLGERDIKVTAVRPQVDYIELRLNAYGDFSTYTLSLEDAAGEPLRDMDALLSKVDFSFKVECPTDLDCQTLGDCSRERSESPEIDYLAKDYESFRRLMLERMSLIAPRWQERNPADLGVALVEVLAYVADQLSYEQDAIATEAYLGTARRRASVRRHARLLDYFMHDGCNARVWVQIAVGRDGTKLSQGTQLLTKVGAAAERIPLAVLVEDSEVLASNPVVFETMHEATLYPNHARMPFFTWGSRECCLPSGSTKATLAGDYPDLKEGDVLVFLEELSPTTGEKEDADPRHRHAVRLSRHPEPVHDALYGVDVTQIEWHPEDALPFPLCVSATTDDGDYLPEVSVALGNIALADHGRTKVVSIDDERRVSEELPPVPQPDDRLARVAAITGSHCAPSEPEPWPPRFRPRLQDGPLTMIPTTLALLAGEKTGRGEKKRVSFGPAAPASTALDLPPEQALPAITLLDSFGREWHPRRDLVSSDAFARECVAETDDDGVATLRFGDDEYGMRPAAGAELKATYRVGNGVAGNIGARSIVHIVSGDQDVLGVSNPMPAAGGVEPETLARVRQNAAQAFRVQQRAVTPTDYAQVAQRRKQVQRAAARVRWTGSWRSVFLSVDRMGGLPVDEDFEDQIVEYMERYRMAGQDVEVEPPRFVALELELFVCILPEYYRSDVKSELLRIFSNRSFPDGGRGFFHPDTLTFGQHVYLSEIHAAAQAVEGVRSVDVRTFQPLLAPSRVHLETGDIEIGPLEIARLDNDPSMPENGLLRIEVEGGR